jgi:HupE / UreJ protein
VKIPRVVLDIGLLAAAIALHATSLAVPVSAHEVRPAYLELKQVSPDAYDVLWKVPARGEDQRFGLYLRLPEDAQIVPPVKADIVAGSYLERYRVTRAGGLEGGEIYVEGLASTLTDVLVRIERTDGSSQVVRLTPDRPAFVYEASASPLQVAAMYGKLGIEHILLGVDHLLFVLSLLLLVSGWGRLVKTITAFTLAHSITLAAATLGFVRVPGPPVEAMIALSIVFVAGEVVRRDRGHAGVAERWPWVVSFAFGLLHGLGFAGALHEIGLPENAIPLALACFNLGVEIGQLLFLAAVLALLAGVRLARRVTPARVPGEAAGEAGWATACAYVIGGVAAFWVVERTLRFFS